MPAECFRFASDAARAASDRATPEYARKVLEAVGLTLGHESAGYSHLAARELQALQAVMA